MCLLNYKKYHQKIFLILLMIITILINIQPNKHIISSLNKKKLYNFINISTKKITATKYNQKTISYIYYRSKISKQINNKFFINYVTDNQNSVTKIISNNNTQSTKFYYSAYGSILLHKIQHNKIKEHFLFNGERYDTHTNLQYLRARFYAPHLKRFLMQDTFLFLNKFNYANDNPISQFDPSGHHTIHKSLFIDSIIGICANLATIFFSTKIVSQNIFKNQALKLLLCMSGTFGLASGTAGIVTSINEDNNLTTITFILSTTSLIFGIATIAITAWNFRGNITNQVQQFSAAFRRASLKSTGVGTNEIFSLENIQEIESKITTETLSPTHAALLQRNLHEASGEMETLSFSRSNTSLRNPLTIEKQSSSLHLQRVLSLVKPLRSTDPTIFSSFELSTIPSAPQETPYNIIESFTTPTKTEIGIQCNLSNGESLLFQDPLTPNALAHLEQHGFSSSSML